MTVASAKEFINRIKDDSAFREAVISCNDKHERMNYARSMGFDFSPSEIKQFKYEYESNCGTSCDDPPPDTCPNDCGQNDDGK